MNVSSKINLQKGALVGTIVRPVVKCRPNRADRAPHYRRTQSVVVKNQSASSLAQYPFTQKRKSPITTDWFQKSINEIVKHLSESPLLHVARFRSMSSLSSIDDDTATPFTSYSSSRHQTLEVDSSVLPTPELWESIAEHLTGADPDAVILVQRVHDVQHHLPSSSSSSSSTTTTTSTATTNDQAVESVCRKLLASGVAESILTGKVGDCCDDDTPNSSSSKRTSILPSSTGDSNTKARVAVRTAAIPNTQPTGQETSYWGVVVQSKLHTGSEGCYLLKTVRNVCSTGCTCTHFSLTRVCPRENLEKQFVDSWLVY